MGSNRTLGKLGPSWQDLPGYHDCWISHVGEDIPATGLAVLERISQPLLGVSGCEQCCPAPFRGCQHCLPPGPMAAVGFPAIFLSHLNFISHQSRRWALHSKPHNVWQIRSFPQNLLHLGLPSCAGCSCGGLKGLRRFKGAVEDSQRSCWRIFRGSPGHRHGGRTGPDMEVTVCAGSVSVWAVGSSLGHEGLALSLLSSSVCLAAG